MAGMENTCRIDGCQRPVHQGRGFRRTVCAGHHDRKFRLGSYREDEPLRDVGSWFSEDPTYQTIHKRLYAKRGAARDHICTECGNQAQTWAYNHCSENERTELRSINGRSVQVVYSVDLDAYDPMCRPCHGKRDYSFNQVKAG